MKYKKEKILILKSDKIGDFINFSPCLKILKDKNPYNSAINAVWWSNSGNKVGQVSLFEYWGKSILKVQSCNKTGCPNDAKQYSEINFE